MQTSFSWFLHASSHLYTGISIRASLYGISIRHLYTASYISMHSLQQKKLLSSSDIVCISKCISMHSLQQKKLLSSSDIFMVSTCVIASLYGISIRHLYTVSLYGISIRASLYGPGWQIALISQISHPKWPPKCIVTSAWSTTEKI